MTNILTHSLTHSLAKISVKNKEKRLSETLRTAYFLGFLNLSPDYSHDSNQNR